MTAPTSSAAVDATEEDGRSRADRGLVGKLLGALLVFVVACLAAAPVSLYNIHTYRAVNAIDEVSYIDSLVQADRGHFIIAEGEFDGATDDHAIQCRGVGGVLVGFEGYTVKPNPAACAGAPHTPYEIRNGADIDPPTYYVLTDIGVKVIRGVGITHDIVQAGRLMGILWGGLGLSLLFLLARLVGARRIPAALTCAAALTLSGVYAYWSYITPHAADLAVGAGATIVGLQWWRRKLPTWTLLITGVVSVMFVASDLTVVMLLVVFILISALMTWRRHLPAAEARTELRRHAFGAAALIVGVVAASLIWLAVRNHYALTHVPAQEKLHVDSFKLSYLLDSIGTFALPFQATVGAVVSFWALGSVVVYASRRSRLQPELQALALAIVPVVALGACVFAISDYVTLHQYFTIHERYGLSALPAVLAFGAANLRSRWAQAFGIVIIAMLCWLVVHPIT